MHGKLSGSQGRPRARLAGILLLSLTLHGLLLIGLKLSLSLPPRDGSSPDLELIVLQPAAPGTEPAKPAVEDSAPSTPAPVPGDEPVSKVIAPEVITLPLSSEPPAATLPDRRVLQAQLRSAARARSPDQLPHRQLGAPADNGPVPDWWNAIDNQVISPAAEPELPWRDGDGGISSRRVLSDGRIICGHQPATSVDGSFNWWMDDTVQRYWQCGRDRSQLVDFRRRTGPG